MLYSINWLNFIVLVALTSSQLTFSCLNSTIEALEKGVKIEIKMVVEKIMVVEFYFPLMKMYLLK